MDIDYIKLAEAGPGEKPYKGCHVLLEKGYIRLIASKLVAGGNVVSINYLGKLDASGSLTELTLVSDKTQPAAEFDAELASFGELLERSGFELVVEDI